MAERARIARHFAPLARNEPGSFSLTDDAAVLSPPPGQQLAITTDSVIEGIHVLPHATPQQFAQKLMRRNLSDLAAMGATPWRYTLNLHTPHGLEESWFDAFAATLAREQQAFGITLIGGDSTSAAQTPIHTTLTCFGLLEGAPLTRGTAQMGDDLYISGTIGDAALGLALLQGKISMAEADPAAMLIGRYHTPQPRLVLGQSLRNIATAAIDISDGLLTDIGQLLTASHLGGRIERAAIPLSPAARHLIAGDASLWPYLLHGGDDYELCFTAPAAMRPALAAQPVTRFGQVTAKKDMVLIDETGAASPFAGGWEHA